MTYHRQADPRLHSRNMSKADRQSAYWMQREDDRILEFLNKEGMASPDLISREVFKSISPGHVEERLKMLQYAGFVFCVGLESYELTWAGEEYLKGQLDARHQPTPTVDRVLR